jgi:hypothetical protein
VAAAQLARSVLSLIRRDLQHSFWPLPQDTGSGGGSAGGGGPASGSGGSGAGGSGNGGSGTGGSGAGGSGSGGQGNGGTGGDGSGSGAQSGNTAAGNAGSGGAGATGSVGGLEGDESLISSTPSIPIALFGTATDLQLDIVLSPGWQDIVYDPTVVGSGPAVTGTVQTVTYVVRPGEGLLRMALDHVADQSIALDDAAATNEQLIAAEVQDIQFSYFDGIQWTSDWDSELLGGLPLAIRVLLTIAEGEGVSELLASGVDVDSAMMDGNVRLVQYDMVIDLPMADLATLQDAATAAATGSTTSDSTATSGSGGTL